MTYYFWKVTGNPLLMPQQFNRDTYAIARYFYWQSPYPARQYHHAAIRDFYNVLELTEFERAHTATGVLAHIFAQLGRTWLLYFSPVLTPALFLLPWVFRDRRIRPLLVLGAAGFVGSALVVFFTPHYIAPIACVMVAVVVQGLRHLRTWRLDGRPAGLFLVRSTIALALLMVPLQVRILATPPQSGTWASIGPERAVIESRLSFLAQAQLVLVRYQPNHNPLWDWVYNGADVDHQKVVWARDMGFAKNQELIRYYGQRQVWLLEADKMPPKLSPYCGQTNGQLSPLVASRATVPAIERVQCP